MKMQMIQMLQTANCPGTILCFLHFLAVYLEGGFSCCFSGRWIFLLYIWKVDGGREKQNCLPSLVRAPANKNAEESGFRKILSQQRLNITSICSLQMSPKLRQNITLQIWKLISSNSWELLADKNLFLILGWEGLRMTRTARLSCTRF